MLYAGERAPEAASATVLPREGPRPPDQARAQSPPNFYPSQRVIPESSKTRGLHPNSSRPDSRFQVYPKPSKLWLFAVLRLFKDIEAENRGFKDRRGLGLVIRYLRYGLRSPFKAPCPENTS